MTRQHELTEERTYEEQVILGSIYNLPENPTPEDIAQVRTLTVPEIADIRRAKYEGYITQWPDDPRKEQWLQDIEEVTKWEQENS